MKRILLVVVKETFLGYIKPETPHTVHILSYPERDQLSTGTMYLPVNKERRMASQNDFIKYRTSQEGFLDRPDLYEYDENGFDKTLFE